MRQRGRIELIMGTMFSGKSTELIRRINLQEVAGKRVLKVKFAADCRYKNKSAISTHTGQQKEAHPFTRLSEMDDLYLQFDCIAIDEGQFFSDLVEFSDNAA